MRRLRGALRGAWLVAILGVKPDLLEEIIRPKVTTLPPPFTGAE